MGDRSETEMIMNENNNNNNNANSKHFVVPGIQLIKQIAPKNPVSVNDNANVDDFNTHTQELKMSESEFIVIPTSTVSRMAVIAGVGGNNIYQIQPMNPSWYEKILKIFYVYQLIYGFMICVSFTLNCIFTLLFAFCFPNIQENNTFGVALAALIFMIPLSHVLAYMILASYELVVDCLYGFPRFLEFFGQSLTIYVQAVFIHGLLLVAPLIGFTVGYVAPREDCNDPLPVSNGFILAFTVSTTCSLILAAIFLIAKSVAGNKFIKQLHVLAADEPPADIYYGIENLNFSIKGFKEMLGNTFAYFFPSSSDNFGDDMGESTWVSNKTFWAIFICRPYVILNNRKSNALKVAKYIAIFMFIFLLVIASVLLIYSKTWIFVVFFVAASYYFIFFLNASVENCRVSWNLIMKLILLLIFVGFILLIIWFIVKKTTIIGILIALVLLHAFIFVAVLMCFFLEILYPGISGKSYPVVIIQSILFCIGIIAAASVGVESGWWYVVYVVLWIFGLFLYYCNPNNIVVPAKLKLQPKNFQNHHLKEGAPLDGSNANILQKHSFFTTGVSVVLSINFAVVTMLFGMILWCGINFSHDSTFESSPTGGDFDSTPTTLMMPYPLCGHTVASLTVLDFAYMSKIAYLPNPDDAQKALDSWINGNNTIYNFRVVKSQNVGLNVFFYDFYDANFNLSVVAVRGSTNPAGNGIDWITNMDLWMESVLTQTIELALPFWSWWPDSYKSRVALFLSLPEIFLRFLVKSETSVPKYYEELDDYIVEIRDQRPGGLYVTGHSLAGGLTQIVAGANGLEGIAFSGPGIGWTRRKLHYIMSSAHKPPTNQLNYCSGKKKHNEEVITSATLNMKLLNVQPDNDPVTLIDKQATMVQSIRCPYSLFTVACHSLTQTICEIARTCGDPQNRGILELSSTTNKMELTCNEWSLGKTK
jgi:hypothetical protein